VVTGGVRRHLGRGGTGHADEAPRESPAVAGVFHLAGMVEHSLRRAQEIERVNVDGTLKVLAAAKKAGVK